MKQIYLILIFLISLQAHATPPTIPASNLSFNVIEGSFFNVGWTPGNGTRRIMIVRAGQPVTAVPQNGIDYAENTNFGSGQQVLPGQYVVYDNAFTSFFLTGLSPATQYFFAIFEYNGTGATSEYLTSSFLSGNGTTATAPTIQAGNISFSNITATSVNISCTPGNGARRLIVAREGSAVNADPANLQPYTGNSSFGNGAQLGSGNYSVFSSTGSNVTVTNLHAGTQYFFSVFEYNGNGEPVYLKPAAIANITTRTIPTIAASNVIVTKADGKELTLGWTNGNGQRRIVVAKQATALTGLPVNGTDYTANEIFGNGATLATGEFVVYNGTGNSTVVKGLNPATGYQFRIFEYDGTLSNTLYLVSSFATASGTTAATPTVQTVSVSATNVLATSANLSWTVGNGRARVVVMKQGSAVNITPQDFTTYTANSDFGSGQQIGTGNFVLTSGPDLFTSVHNLQANTTYHIAIFEYNGFNQPLYLSPAKTFSFTTAGPVPVKLTSFTAMVINKEVRLYWTTATEINSSHFIIQRSNDAVHFSNIGTQAAAGNSQVPLNYDFLDKQPLKGNSFYRLQLVDKDGQLEYSRMINVHIDDEKTVLLQNNTVHDKLILKAGTVNAITGWRIINAAGQELKKGSLKDAQTEINIASLQRGIYRIQFFNNKTNTVESFIKL